VTSVCIHLVLLNALGLTGATPPARLVCSPMSWSTDSQWLSYTVVSDLEVQGLSRAWLFEPFRETPAREAPSTTDRIGSRALLYRIWTTAHGDGTSVLIEESRWPLSAPSWSPRGKSFAYSRFVARSSETHPSDDRGRLEVVVQSALDVRKVVWSSQEITLDQEVRALIPHLSCSWSSDGVYLAVPLPARQPGVAFINTHTKQRVLSIDRAILPAWSPDGSKCVYIRSEGERDSVEFIERRGLGFSQPRAIELSGMPRSAPFWDAYGRSIILVVEKPLAAKALTKIPDLDLVRFSLDNRESNRLLSFVPEQRRRKTKVRGVTIDFDRESDRCFFSLDLEGRDFNLVSCTPQEHEFQQPFHPLDVAQRIGSLAVSPDAKWVAIRFGGIDNLSPPAVLDTETDRTVLLVPDEISRKQWQSQLVSVATRLLSAALPPASIDGQAVSRPTLLPLPDEFAALGSVIPRLDRIAKHGSSLCPAPAPQPDLHDQSVLEPADLQARLFFDFLQGRFPEAATDLDALEEHVESPAHRLALLSLRAQILWSDGHHDRARGIIDYLVATAGSSTERIEETPLGPVATKEVSPGQAWARYLSLQSVEQPLGHAGPGRAGFAGDVDLMPRNLFDVPDFPILDTPRK
jgi:Tol biopolymer transport system component